MSRSLLSFFFFFNDTATTEIYTLSLHDALPISGFVKVTPAHDATDFEIGLRHELEMPLVMTEDGRMEHATRVRSEEHTSELQSQSNLVCRLLLEKKKNLH